MNGNDPHDTYTVYDDYGNVCFVLPPPAADGLTEEGVYDARSAILQNYAYIYRYDKYNRCIYKKLLVVTLFTRFMTLPTALFSLKTVNSVNETSGLSVFPTGLAVLY